MTDSNGDVSEEQEEQEEQLYNSLLPYYSELETESQTYIKQIKENICKGIILLDKQCENWFLEFYEYLHFYKRKLPKEDHAYFVKVFYEFIFSEHVNILLADTAIDILHILLKKPHSLSRDDIVIDWFQIYSYCVTNFESKNARLLMRVQTPGFKKKLFNLIPYLREFFPIEATQQILDQFLPHLCPYHDSEMKKATKYLLFFLPTKLKQSEADRGWKLWFTEIIDFVTTFHFYRTWERNLMQLLSRLARQTIGYIDWNPYVPQIFAGLHKIVFGGSQSDINCLCTWIVSIIGNNNRILMKHFKQLLQALEKYCYPIEGEFSKRNSYILRTFTSRLVNRLHKERFRERPLLSPIPDSYKVTDDECEEIVSSLMPLLLKALFSPTLAADSEIAMHNLSLICPQVVCDSVKETFFVSVETVTEPHRLVPSIDCLTAVARSMIEFNGRKLTSDIIRILESCLLAIDINDFEKTTSALQLIQIISINVPLEGKPFQLIATEFVARIFHIIDNSDPDVWHKTELFKDSSYCEKEEKNLFNLINQTFKVILIQCSPAIFEEVIQQLYKLIVNAIYEPSVCGDEIGSFCRSCVQVDPNKTLDVFFPHFSNLVLKLTEDPKCFNEENIDKQLAFAFCIVSKLCSTRAKHLNKYKTKLLNVIDRGLQFNFKSGYLYVTSLFRRLLVCSTNVWTFDFKSPADGSWGKGCDIKSINIDWSVPDDDDYQFVQYLIDTYLLAELKEFEKWKNNEIQMTKEECLRRLGVINNFIYGLCTVLPMWESEIIQAEKSYVPLNIETFKIVGTKDINFSNGKNIREVVTNSLREILSFLKNRRENDTKSFLEVIDTIMELLNDFGATSEIKYITPVVTSDVNAYLENRLVEKSKAKTRFTIVQKSLMQHEYRLLRRYRGHQLTIIHRDLTLDLFPLLTSIYKNVSRKVENFLRHTLEKWPCMTVYAVSEINKITSRDMTNNEFEGILRLFTSSSSTSKSRSLLFSTDWKSAKQIWLSLLKTKYPYKDTVIDSFKSILYQMNSSSSYFYGYLNFTFMVSDKCFIEAKKLWSVGTQLICSEPSQGEIDSARKAIKKRFDNNVKEYQDWIVQLIELINAKKMHWRYNELAFRLLFSLIREDIPYPESGIKIFVENMNNELLVIRKICICAVGYILQQQKRKHVKKKVDYFENYSLQYQLNVNYLDENIWNSTIFVEKSYWCFYKWPKWELFVYEDPSKQPKVNRSIVELSEREKIIFDFFVNDKKVKKLIDFLSLEENKGKDKVDFRRLFLFKSLSRNYGFSVFEMIIPNILYLVSHPNESKQRCASEIITGLARGSKHWPLSDIKLLRDFLSPIIKQIFQKMTQETSLDWTIFCATCFDNRDTRKFCWFVDLILENFMSTNKQVFYNTMALQCLNSLLSYQYWRGLILLQNILPICESRLGEDFLEIRIRVAYVLKYIFQYDIKKFDKTLKSSPKSADFVEKVLPQLLEYNKENMTDAEHKICLNKIKTVCEWLRLTDISPYPIESHYYRLISIFCDVHRETKDVEVTERAASALTTLASTVIVNNSAFSALESCKDVLSRKYWNSRLKAAQFLTVFVDHNFFRVFVYSSTILQLLYQLLEDENINVRSAAMTTLITCIEKSMIIVNSEVINGFMQRTKVTDKEKISKRHAGYLGLCAIIEAYPFDIPSFIPTILVYLTSHLNEKQPIPTTIKDTFRNFRRTHLDNWREHEKKFTTLQLEQLDVLISANYYS